MRGMGSIRHFAALLIAATLAIAGCSDSTDSADGADTAESTDGAATAAGVRLVSPEDGAAIQADPPAELVVLDVRTPEEFAEGHLEDAVMIDFYADGFADEIAQLDPDAPYLLYCRSGNRSGQTAALMRDLGFTDVAEIDGGIQAWNGAGLEVVDS